jgi:3-oxoacyl-[acyl-carrier-protein] synthase-3
MISNAILPVEIAALGSYLPERALTNQDFEKMVETSDDWITQRTGIKVRRIAAENEATSDLAVRAARMALERAALDPQAVDAIIVATCTPDYHFPATACLVQSAIGAKNAAGFDLEAACCGFLFGLNHAAAAIAGGLLKNVLVIGAETLSRFTDYSDRGSCILFGDGAGAVLLTPSRNGGELIYCEMGSDGSGGDLAIVPAGGSRNPASEETVRQRAHYMRLNGPEVFKWAVNKLGELVTRMPEQTGIPLDDIKLIVPHQSNVRIIQSFCQRAGIPEGKAYINIDRVGNTSAASIPLALDEAVQEGRLQRGDLVLLLAFGGGLTWGTALLRY